MEFNLYEVKSKNKEIIFNLMQLYTYELSFFEGETTIFRLLDKGVFAISKYIDLYRKEENRHPYLLKCDNEIAGFVMIRFNKKNMYEIAEFFVLNKYRKLGAGTLLKNKPAQNFWRKVVSDFSKDNYSEELIRNNSRYAFYFKN